MSVSRPLIFVVDDDASVRRSLQRLLSVGGFATEMFASAEQALGRGSLDDCNALIVDVRMPGMSGLELQSQLLNAGHRKPIIFVTAYADPPAEMKAMAAGAAGFFMKPFDGEKLMLRLRESLGMAQRTDSPP